MNPERSLCEITCRSASPDVLGALESEGVTVDQLGEYVRIIAEGNVNLTLNRLLESGADIQSVVPKRESLEDLFVKESTRVEEEAVA